jgi:hypothetical protein
MTEDTTLPAHPPGLAYAARRRAPFSVLGVRERGGRIVASDYPPLATDELTPTTLLAVKNWRLRR